MSNPAVTFGCCLPPSMVGRSSFPYRASEPVERLQTQRVLRMGVGLLISSSENAPSNCEYPGEWLWATPRTGLTLLLGEPMVPRK
jgi:hypothetical protein